MRKTIPGILLILVLTGMLTFAINIRLVESPTPPETEWDEPLGGASNEQALSVVQTGDGGYALAGWTASFGAGGNDFWLVKTDASGNHQWNQTYGGTNKDVANSMVQTSDGGYALAGDTLSFGGWDAWLVKTDAIGNMEWNQTYGGTDMDIAFSLVQTEPDFGYALAGYTRSFGAGDWDFWLVKTDASGNHQWNQTYGGTNKDNLRSMVQTSDGGYALAGYTYSSGAGDSDFWLVKTDASGNHQWNQTYGGTSVEQALSVVQTGDGGYAVAGETWSFGAGSRDFWLVKTDSAGNMEWNKTYGGANMEEAYSMVLTEDGGYALLGYTNSFGVGGQDFWLVKTDSAGNMEWNQTYGGTSVEQALSVVQTGDGGYALAGYTRSFGAGGDDFWLIKLFGPDWPMFHHDLKNSGFSTSTAPNTNNTLWNRTIGYMVWSSPAILDGRVYIGLGDLGSEVYALNATTGDEIWNFTAGGWVYSGPAVVDERVFFGSRDGKVYALNATDGNHIWNFTTGGYVTSSPSVAYGMVFVGSDDTKVYALNATTGDEIWNFTTGDWIRYSSAAVANGIVYIGSRDTKVYALNATTGDEIWSFTTGGAVYSSPTLANGMVFVGSYTPDNKVYALNATDSAEIWSYTTGDSVFSSAAVAYGMIYTASHDNRVYALNTSNGDHIWNFTTGSPVESSPAVADGKVFIGSKDSRIYALNALNGSEIWSFKTDGDVNSSPGIAHGNVFVGSYDGNIYAFGDAYMPTSARALKESALTELESALSFDPGDDDLVQAIDYLLMSLGDERGRELGSEVIWIDDWHVSEEKGVDTFQYEEAAIDKLDAYVLNEDNVDTGVAAIIDSVREKLYKADKSIAGKAIEEAETVGGVPSDIDKAKELYQDAVDTYAAGTYAHSSPKLSDVIDLFEEAWEKAVNSH